eukprot:6199922-Pleurochrysis_carterae.AAC.2
MSRRLTDARNHTFLRFAAKVCSDNTQIEMCIFSLLHVKETTSHGEVVSAVHCTCHDMQVLDLLGKDVPSEMRQWQTH